MADTMYAWSPIRNGGEVISVVDNMGRDRRVVSERTIIPVGDKVTPKDVGGDEAFEQMVEAGSIRPYPYPKDLDPNSSESPVEFLRRRLREASEQEVSEEQQLLLATGQGAVVTDEELVARQPENAKGVKEASGQGTSK